MLVKNKNISLNREKKKCVEHIGTSIYTWVGD